MEKSCASPQIAENHAAVVVMDNDDFKSDTLAGTSLSNHRTKVMFVQNECLRKEMSHFSDQPSMTTPGELKNVVEDLNNITPYNNIKTGEPSIPPSFNIQPTSTSDILFDEVLHTLVRIDKVYENIQLYDQQVGSFSGFQSLLLCDSTTKIKPYCWLSFPKPPQVCGPWSDAIEEKTSPFLLLTGDQPVYTSTSIHLDRYTPRPVCTSTSSMHLDLYAPRPVCTSTCMHLDLYAPRPVCTSTGMHLDLYAPRSVCTSTCMHLDLYAPRPVCTSTGMHLDRYTP